MRILALLFWIIVIILGITFASLNSHAANINYYIGTVPVYLPLLLLIELVIGAILGICAMLPWVMKNKSTVRKLKSRVRNLEEEVNNLRNIPIRDHH